MASDTALEQPMFATFWICTKRHGCRDSAPKLKRRIMIGTYALSAGYYDAYYKKASQVRALMKRDF